MKFLVILLVLASLVESRHRCKVGAMCHGKIYKPSKPKPWRPTRPTPRPKPPKDHSRTIHRLEKDMEDVIKRLDGLKGLEEKLDGMKESQDRLAEAAAAVVEVLGGSR